MKNEIVYNEEMRKMNISEQLGARRPIGHPQIGKNCSSKLVNSLLLALESL